jgi:predicted metal-binding protein
MAKKLYCRKKVHGLHSEISTLKVIYQTSGKTTYPLEVGYCILETQVVPVDKALTTEACLRGCKLYGRNGGCPPVSPEFNHLPGKSLVVIYAKIQTCHYPIKVLNGSHYVRWAFVETFMTGLTNRIGKALAGSLGGYFLSSGNCHGCRPKPCAFKEGKKCRNPTARTFSLESTGVIVTELMKLCFGIELQWWQRDNPSYIPEFMVKVVGIKMEKTAGSVVKQAIEKAVSAWE